MSLSDHALNNLYDTSLPFRLYADHAHGVTFQELAALSGRSESWIEERVEAMRLCLQKQVRVDISSPPRRCPDSVWAAQVWD